MTHGRTHHEHGDDRSRGDAVAAYNRVRDESNPAMERQRVGVRDNALRR